VLTKRMKPLSRTGTVAARPVATPCRNSPSDWFWSELTHLQGRWDVRRHPFYVRWSDGELSLGQLVSYAEEYHHLVVALADVSRQAAFKADGPLSTLLADHAAEESEHVELWREFSRSVGWGPESSWCYGADPHEATTECARTWAGSPGRTLAQDLVTLYAVEHPQPAISATKLDGLVRYYGFDEGPATEYFRLHMRVDAAHAALARAALDDAYERADPFALLSQAESVHRSYWHMLDAIEEEQNR
jgi:pyrroloquinoline-quinone synthase